MSENSVHHELILSMYNTYKEQVKYPLTFRFYGLDKKFQRIGLNARQRQKYQRDTFFA